MFKFLKNLFSSSSMPMLTVGSKAPDFSLLDQDGVRKSMADFLTHFPKSFLLIYFYPKDDTPGCTKEACTIRDAYGDFAKASTVVVGISKDSPASHTEFRKKYELPFALLSDPDQVTIKAYGASGGLFTKRISYLIDQEGVIVRVYPDVDPAGHAGQILKDILELQG